MIIAEYRREDDHRIRRQRRKRDVDTTEAPVISCPSQKCVVTKGPVVRSRDRNLGVHPWVIGHGGMRYGNHRGRSQVPSDRMQ